MSFLNTTLLAANNSNDSAITVYTFVMVTITFMIYLYIGWRSRVKETEGFYVAGRGVPAFANGAATAADWMSAASFIGLAGSVSFLGHDGSAYLMGWTGGYVLLALLLAPYLRKFGQFTVPDFVGERYSSNATRTVAALCAVAVSLVYVGGQMRGVGIVFSRFLEVPIWAGVVVGMIIVAFFAVLGGMKGITWTQVVQFFILIAAFMIPACALSVQFTDSWVPQIGLVNSDITERLNQIQTDLGFSAYTEPFAQRSKLDMFCLTLALMLGTAGLPHVIVRFYTVRSVRAARYSAGWALLFIAILYTTAPALAVFARYNVLDTLDGAKVANVVSDDESTVDGEEKTEVYTLIKEDKNGDQTPVAWVDKWQETGLIKFDDKDNNDEISLKSQDGKFAEATIDRDIIVLSTPEVAGLAPWVVAIVATGGLAAALSTAAGLLLVISSSIAHDLYVHLVDPTASEAKRVAVGRVMILVAIVFAGYFGIYPPGFVAQVVAFAFGLAAASFFPVILLGIFDTRTNWQGAISGMTAGILFTGTYIIGCRFDKIIPGATEPLFEPWLFGISPEGIGVVGCLINLVITFGVSRMTPPPPKEVQEFVESVRVPKIALDKPVDPETHHM